MNKTPDPNIKIVLTQNQLESLVNSIHNSSTFNGEFSMLELQNLKLLNEAKKDTSHTDYLAQLQEIDVGDPEGSHYNADELLCEILQKHGYTKLVEYYKSMEKWYA